VRTVVRSAIVHLCPYRDERDIGTVELTFNGPAPELHALADRLRSSANEKITHEALTERLAYETEAAVVTRWVTAGLEVEVRCGT
jgi:NADPH-dependent 7-cyano-7-deazaguanine reductase QueF